MYIGATGQVGLVLTLSLCGAACSKVFVSLAITALAWRYFGRLGVFIWFSIVLLPLIYVHAIWLPLHGINGWTGEPREKYHALRAAGLHLTGEPQPPKARRQIVAN